MTADNSTIETDRTGADGTAMDTAEADSPKLPRNHDWRLAKSAGDPASLPHGPASSTMLGLASGFVRPAGQMLEAEPVSGLTAMEAGGAASSLDGPESRNPMLDLLVKDERDLAGLIAYGLYKLSKRDWLSAFQQANAREPSAAELDAFVIGERTERRLAGYRRQAESGLATLALQAAPVDQPAAPSAEAETLPVERSKMAAILHQLTRTPMPAPVSEPVRSEPIRRMANGRPMPQGEPSLKTLLRYLLILTGLVICLAILVNYAKSTVFVN